MLRRHFITGDEKPDFIITYYAPEHIPFFNGYKDEIDSLMLNDNLEFETKYQFKCILDTFDDGVGQYGIKLLSDNNGLWCSNWTIRFDTLNEFGSLGFYYELSSHIKYNNTNDITCIILPKEIKHLDGTLMADPNHYNYSVEIITLPEYLETFNNKVLYSLQAIKNIVIPDTVTFMSDHTLQIDCDSDDVGSANTGNMSLEEIILKPFTPPDSDTNNPIGVYDTTRYINPNLKIRVYADCIDKYKNDAIWGQYFDLYDTINSTIIYIDSEGNRQLCELYGTDVEFTHKGLIEDVSTQAIYLPNSVTEIQHNSFDDLINLRIIRIPNTISYIGAYAFYSAHVDILQISFDGTKEEWESVEKDPNWLYSLSNVIISCTDGDIEL